MGYSVYEIWAVGASVPGGSVVSRHETREAAEAAKAECEQAEALRQRQPRMSMREARAAVKASYGYDVPGAAQKMRECVKHAYEVRED